MNKDITINCVEPLSDLETFIKDIPAQLRTGDRIHMKTLKFINLMRKYESLFPMFSPPSIKCPFPRNWVIHVIFLSMSNSSAIIPMRRKGKECSFSK